MEDSQLRPTNDHRRSPGRVPMSVVRDDRTASGRSSEPGQSNQALFEEFPDFVSTRHVLADRLDDLVPDIDAATRDDCRQALELIDRAVGYLMMVKVVTRSPRFAPIVWELKERIRQEKAAIIELRRPFHTVLDEDARGSGTSERAVLETKAVRRHADARRRRTRQAQAEAFFAANEERLASGREVVMKPFDEWLVRSTRDGGW